MEFLLYRNAELGRLLLQKAQAPIVVLAPGTSTSIVSDNKLYWKALAFIVFNDSSKFILVRLFFIKASEPIVVTLEGITTVVNLL